MQAVKYLKALRFSLIICALLTLPAQASSCLDSLKAEPYNSKTLSKYFDIQFKELKLSKIKEPQKILSFSFKSKEKLSNKEQENLYYHALIRYDDFLAKQTCSARTDRVFFLFPKTTMTISVKDLTRIRKEKRRPAWEAHALLRSQVVHEKP